jgi:hypothetical protein
MKSLLFLFSILVSAPAFANSVSINTGVGTGYTDSDAFQADCQSKVASISSALSSDGIQVSTHATVLGVEHGCSADCTYPPYFEMTGGICDAILTSDGTLAVITSKFKVTADKCNESLVESSDHSIYHNIYFDDYDRCVIDSIYKN